MTPLDVRIRVTAAVDPSHELLVRGWDVGVPGLAVTENTFEGADCRTWTVIHIASGCVFTGRSYKSPEGAVAFAHALAGAYDWTLSGVAVSNNDVMGIVAAALLAHPPDARVHSMTVGDDELRDWQP